MSLPKEKITLAFILKLKKDFEREGLSGVVADHVLLELIESFEHLHEDDSEGELQQKSAIDDDLKPESIDFDLTSKEEEEDKSDKKSDEKVEKEKETHSTNSKKEKEVTSEESSGKSGDEDSTRSQKLQQMSPENRQQFLTETWKKVHANSDKQGKRKSTLEQKAGRDLQKTSKDQINKKTGKKVRKFLFKKGEEREYAKRANTSKDLFIRSDIEGFDTRNGSLKINKKK